MCSYLRKKMLVHRRGKLSYCYTLYTVQIYTRGKSPSPKLLNVHLCRLSVLHKLLVAEPLEIPNCLLLGL